MKQTLPLRVLPLLVSLVLATAVFSGSATKDDGFKQIFDGKTLNGWKVSERPENWNVVDGCIRGTGSRSHLFYVAEEFKNFHFKVDVKTERERTNSGIYFHSKFQVGGWPRQGFESQVNVSHGDPVKTGSLYNLVKFINWTPCKDKEWWTHHIIVRGKRVTTKIEIKGKVVFEFEYVEPAEVKGPGSRALSKGLFAFQQHDPGSEISYKDVMVKKLSD